MESKEEFYDIMLECANCGSSPDDPTNIPMGTYWEVYLEETEYKCDYCGCSRRMKRA